MSANSKIEWTDHTFNPWIGCTKVSPGCAHCYAEALDLRFHQGAHWGPGKPRLRTSPANWKEPRKWNREAEKLRRFDVGICKRIGTVEHLQEQPRRRSHVVEATRDCGQKTLWEFTEEQWNAGNPVRPRVFCASLADWLDEEVPIAWLADLLQLIHATPHLDWLLLTKRPYNWRSRIESAFVAYSSGDHSGLDTEERLIMMNWLDSWLSGTPPENVWIGTTVEDQTRADLRIPALLQIPAHLRFLSCEPLLCPLDLKSWLTPWNTHHLSLNIAGAIRNRSFSGFTGDDGSILSPAAVEAELRRLLEQGHRLFPMGPCPEFDPQTGCPGHRKPLDLHWLICGGESGAQARPMHPAWAQSLRDQCQAAKVPFFFKQWGEWLPVGQRTQQPLDLDRRYKGHDWRDTPPGADRPSTKSLRVGKAAASHLLDGHQHQAFPTSITSAA